MGDKSKIQWTDATWNIVTGCTHSGMPGCDNCYARRLFPRVYGHQQGREFTDVQTHPDRLDKPLRWRKPRRVFACSMGDLFHEDVSPDFIAAALGVMAESEQHEFQVLTKRPETMRRFFEARLGPHEDMHTLCRHIASETTGRGLMPEMGEPTPWPLPNVWLGASASTQADLERVVPDLLATPAAVRFLSIEPMLEEISLESTLALIDENGDSYASRCDPGGESSISWIICGCESGPKRRPMKLDWARSVVDQCKAAGVPVFVKQLDIDGRVLKDPSEWPEDLKIRQYPYDEARAKNGGTK